jgi:multidrug resistance efflux pump
VSPSAADLSAQLDALEAQASQAELQLTQTVLTAQAPQ